MRAASSGWGIVWILWASGCALPGAPGPQSEFGHHAKGKIGITHGEERASANFYWVSSKDSHRIDIWGAFGKGHTRIIYSEGHLEAQLPRGEVVRGAEAQEIIDKALGTDFPLTVLASWLRFRPDQSGFAFERLGEAEGRIAAFRQLGWLVELQEVYPDSRNQLPARLAISKDETYLRLFFREWRGRLE